MKKIPLYAMAHARSGDKGDGSNVGVLAYDDRGYGIGVAGRADAVAHVHDDRVLGRDLAHGGVYRGVLQWRAIRHEGRGPLHAA